MFRQTVVLIKNKGIDLWKMNFIYDFVPAFTVMVTVLLFTYNFLFVLLEARSTILLKYNNEVIFLPCFLLYIWRKQTKKHLQQLVVCNKNQVRFCS